MMFLTYEQLGLYVTASDCAVIRAAKQTFSATIRRREHRTARHAVYRAMLARHRRLQSRSDVED
jgi:hypothetical protein